MKKPKISVIIPAYNEEKSISACLKSILHQEIPQEDYEVIVVDNNSTDKTVRIVKEKFSSINLVFEKKQGVVFARIAGMKYAKSELIVFTDADSIVKPYWLKNLINAYKDPAVIAVGGFSNLNPKNTLVRIAEPILNTVNPYFKLMSGYNLSFRKKAYKNVSGFSSKVNLCEDFYISIKIQKTGKVLILKDGGVSTSSRRFSSAKEFFPYAVKSLINITSITLFEKSVFFNFKPIRKLKKPPLDSK